MGNCTPYSVRVITEDQLQSVSNKTNPELADSIRENIKNNRVYVALPDGACLNDYKVVGDKITLTYTLADGEKEMSRLILKPRVFRVGVQT